MDAHVDTRCYCIYQKFWVLPSLARHYQRLSRLETQDANFEWWELQAFFTSIRDEIVADTYRLRAACELTHRELHAIDPENLIRVPRALQHKDAQFETLVQLCHDELCMRLTDSGVAPTTQQHRAAVRTIAQTLAAVKNWEVTVKEVLWLLDTHEEPFGVLVRIDTQFEPAGNNFKSWYAIGHNTASVPASAIVYDGRIRPSSWDPRESTWTPSMGYYARAYAFQSALGQNFSEALNSSHLPKGLEMAARHSSKFSNVNAARCVSLIGLAASRQSTHTRIPQGGVCADIIASHFLDALRSRDGRWKFRSDLTKLLGVAAYWRHP